MEHSELVATLRVFSIKEQEQLALFLQSPYCTGVSDTTTEAALVRYIYSVLQKPGNDNMQGLEHQEIYAALYPNRPFRQQTLNNLTSITLKLVRRFMEAESLSKLKRPTHEHAAIIEFLNEKGAFALSEKYLKRLDRTKAPDDTWDDTDFYVNWRAENIRSRFLGMHGPQTDDYNLRESLVALEKFYLAERLSLLSALFNQNRLTPILDPKERQALIDDLNRWSDHPFFHHHLVQLYLKALLFFHLDGEAAEQAFQEFMDLLTIHENRLSAQHLKRMETFAYNFCARRYSIEKYRNIVFDIFRRWVQPERLGPNQMIQSSELLSLVQTGLIGKRFEWVREFLETFRKRVQGIQPSEDYYQFCKAQYHFYRGEFDQARKIIVQLNFHEIHYKYMAKTLEIKLYFETGEEDFELVESRLNSMAVALHRETNMPREKKVRYTKFVNFIQRLNRWRGQLKPNRKRLEAIREDVRNAQNTAEWRWLMQKLDEFSSNLGTK